MWKVYLWVYSIVAGLGSIIILSKFSTSTFAELLGPVETLIIIAGIYSYVYKKKIFSPRTALVLFWWFIVTAVLSFLRALNVLSIPQPLNFLFETGVEYTLISLIIGVLFTAPGIYIFYKLAYQNVKS